MPMRDEIAPRPLSSEKRSLGEPWHSLLALSGNPVFVAVCAAALAGLLATVLLQLTLLHSDVVEMLAAPFR
jgi:hypothetical protein